MKRQIDRLFAQATVLLALALYTVMQATVQAAGWTTNAPLTTARQQHTATLLPNGKVLFAGGTPGFSGTNRAELYDPATGVSTPTGSLVAGRTRHTATLLM